jgi:hypothetical protein
MATTYMDSNNDDHPLVEDKGGETIVATQANVNRSGNWALDDEEALLDLLKRHNFDFAQTLMSLQNDQHR